MKRVLSLLLSLALIGSVATLPAAAAGGKVSATLEPGKVKLSNICAEEIFVMGTGFRDGLMPISQMVNGVTQYGYMNTKGEITIPIQYGWATNFQNGAAIVTKPSTNQTLSGIIDTTGKILLELKYELTPPEDSNGGLILVNEPVEYTPETPYLNRLGFVDYKGKFVVPMGTYDTARSFEDGVAWVQKGNAISRLDHTGKVTSTFTVSKDEKICSRSAAYVSTSRFDGSTHFGCVYDPQGKVLVAPGRYEHISIKESDYAAVEKDGKYGLITLPGGQLLLPCTEDNALEFGITNDLICLHGVYYDRSGKPIQFITDMFAPGGATFTADSSLKYFSIRKDQASAPAEETTVDATGTVLFHGLVNFPFENGLTTATKGRSTYIINDKFEILKDISKFVPEYGRASTISEGYIAISTQLAHYAPGDVKIPIYYLNTEGQLVWSDEGISKPEDSKAAYAYQVINGYSLVLYPNGDVSVLHFPKNAAPSLENFAAVSPYAEGQFKDTQAGQWYSAGIQAAYEMGLMKGTAKDTFDLNGEITLGSAVTTAARLHSIYHTGSAEFAAGTPWYKPYVDYALENGILAKGFEDYNRPATRAEFAAILSGALPDAALAPQYTIADNSLPDVKLSDANGPAIYRLYRGGILTGNDAKGTFTPDSSISRSAAATIVARMARVSLRTSFTPAA